MILKFPQIPNVWDRRRRYCLNIFKGTVHVLYRHHFGHVNLLDIVIYSPDLYVNNPQAYWIRALLDFVMLNIYQGGINLLIMDCLFNL